MKVTEYLGGRTLEVRHKIVKMIAPKLYADYTRIASDGIPRPMISFLKNQNHTNLIGAEIGVSTGQNALSILQELPMKRLYLIDPYEEYFENNLSVVNHIYTEAIARSKLSKYPQAIFIREYSEDALFYISDILDFVYIDGNHDYVHVKKDIEAYSARVKKHGVVGGHDYNAVCPDVVRAVNDYGREHGLSMFTCYPDWWFIHE